MIHRNICPICGNENPEESEFCQICHANLQTLPQDIYPAESEPKTPSEQPAVDPALTDPGEPDPNSLIPIWLQQRFKEKHEKTNFDFDSYTDAIFGVSDEQKSASPTKVLKPKPRKPKKQGPIYQPELEKLMDPPLVEDEEGTEKSVPETNPTLIDFKTIRPVKKWDDPEQQQVMETVRQQSEKAFAVPEQIPLLWRQDPALVDEPDEAKSAADDDDEESISSVSPTKLADYAELTAASEQTPADENTAEAQPAASESGEFEPESGSLLAEFMNEMNRSSVTPAPQELKDNASGTVFYSGNSHPDESEPEETVEIPIPAEENGSSAAFLDQILQGIGFHVEGTEPAEDPAETAPAADSGTVNVSTSSVSAQASAPENGSVPAADPAPDPGNGTEAPEPDPALIEVDPLNDIEPLPEKTDDPDEQDIPWDLFGSQDMSLPQSPEDPAYRTFSRSSIPEEPGSTSYQQRMMSSVLGKIIRAENYVAPQKKEANRRVSIWARLFWSLAALGGIVLILMTGITGRIRLPAVPAAPETETFYAAAENVSGNVLMVVDYTPAYGAELDAASDVLLRTLEDKAGKVYISALNPAAMPRTREILRNHGEKVEFSGWWPAGVISIRSRLASGNIPDQIWLLTSESGSVRDWAEQLAVSGENRKLHVLASGQLEPLLAPYLRSGLVSSAMSRDRDLLHYGSSENAPDAHLFAVWYLAALLPLAWICGVFTRFLRSDPEYGRKKAPAEKERGQNNDKEADHDGSF